MFNPGDLPVAFGMSDQLRQIFSQGWLPAGENQAQWDKLLAGYPTVGNLMAGLIIGVDATQARVYARDGSTVKIPWSALSWVIRGKRPADVFKTGDIIRLYNSAEGKWQLTQIPRVEGALISVAPADGAIISLVGGVSKYCSLSLSDASWVVSLDITLGRGLTLAGRHPGTPLAHLQNQP